MLIQEGSIACRTHGAGVNPLTSAPSLAFSGFQAPQPARHPQENALGGLPGVPGEGRRHPALQAAADRAKVLGFGRALAARLGKAQREEVKDPRRFCFSSKYFAKANRPLCGSSSRGFPHRLQEFPWALQQRRKKSAPRNVPSAPRQKLTGTGSVFPAPGVPQTCNAVRAHGISDS